MNHALESFKVWDEIDRTISYNDTDVFFLHPSYIPPGNHSKEWRPLSSCSGDKSVSLAFLPRLSRAPACPGRPPELLALCRTADGLQHSSVSSTSAAARSCRARYSRSITSAGRCRRRHASSQTKTDCCSRPVRPAAMATQRRWDCRDGVYGVVTTSWSVLV